MHQGWASVRTGSGGGLGLANKCRAGRQAGRQGEKGRRASCLLGSGWIPRQRGSRARSCLSLSASSLMSSLTLETHDSCGRPAQY